MSKAIRRLKVVLALVLALGALPLGLWLALSLGSGVGSQASLRLADLRWQNVDGSWSTLNKSQAPYTLLFLGYLSCDSVCPERLSEMALISRSVSREQLQLLFLTIDATRDTPEVRQQLVDTLGIQSGQLEPQALQALRSQLQDRGQGLSRHSTRTYLLARDGQVLHVFQGSALTEQAVQEHVAKLGTSI